MRPVVVPFFISHRGCPHRCIFCDQAALSGSGGALPDAGEIAATVHTYRASSRRSQVEVAFYGGTFTAQPLTEQRRLLDAVQPLRAAGVVSGIRLSTRPDAVDAAAARFLADRGVTLVELGVQSLDDMVLARTERGYTAAAVTAAVQALRSHGLGVGIQLMPGLPGDTPARSLASCHRALALAPDCLRLYPTLVLRGTRLAELYAAGAYAPPTLTETVALGGELLAAAWRRGVPVIRLGVQPGEELQPGASVVAGPYHPALRYLVEAERCHDTLARLLAPLAPDLPATIVCAPRDVSLVAGERRRNLARLQQGRSAPLTVRQAPEQDRYELRVEADGRCHRTHMYQDDTIERTERAA